MATSYRLETSQGLAMGADPESVIKLNDAKADARVRQLTNKVDFLKAQLATEQSAGEDLRKALSSSRAKLDELRDEFRIRMHEAEQLKKTAVDDMEQRMEVIYEDRMMELTTLQTKFMMMQGQLQEAFQVCCCCDRDQIYGLSC